jgi:CheY-like chemotaxis protein
VAPFDRGPAKTVLVIEDDPAITRLETDVLRDAGYGAESVADAQAAREKAKKVPYAGIVFDLGVPGSQGFVTAEEVSLLEANRHTPIIIVGSDEPDGRKRAFEVGAVAFMSKPFTSEAFRSVIYSVIGPAGPRAAAAPRPAARPVPVRNSLELPPPRPAPADPAADLPLESPRTAPAEHAIPVSFQGGQVYWCEPDSEGHWRCGRCETGTVAAAEPGARCSVCQAEVVLEPRASRSGLGWLIVLLVLAAAGVAGWLLLGELPSE